jgi:leucyl-tRNA synthetase
VTVPSSASPDEVRIAALAQARIANLVTGEEPRKVIVVPGRLINVVP